MTKATGEHRWQFFTAGDFLQVSLSSGADLMALDTLDQKLWAALACPVSGLHFDARTLALVDADGDGRIRAPELIAAVKWAGGLLRNSDDLLARDDSLPLAAIDDSTDEGSAMLASVRHVLALVGRGDAEQIGLEDTAEAAELFAQMDFNGDGIITADTAGDDEALRAVVGDIILALGEDTDLSGKPGISRDKLDLFLAEAAALAELARQPQEDPALLPLGDTTAEAAAAVDAVRAKVTDYFTRCRLASFDPRAGALLNRDEHEFEALAAELVPGMEEIAKFPLSHVEARKPLNLVEDVNPAWDEAVRNFHAAVVPLLGERDELSFGDWQTIQAKLASFEAWSNAMSESALRELPVERVQEILASGAGEKLAALIDKDLAEADTAAAIAGVDKLVRYRRHLHELCENFVNFRHFYGVEKPAIFQAGRLYLDQRSCELTLQVNDDAKQSTMAALAGTYLVYCDCVRKSTGETRQIVSAITNGDDDNLMAGRNGIYYDRDGRDWDATITRLVENPISLRQAFWSPYKKVVRLIEEQVAKRAAAADEAASAKLETAAEQTANVDQVKPPEGRRIDVGTGAALGVSFGALETALASLACYGTGLVRLPFWQICVALAVLLMIISGPSVLIAWLKLRKRNLGPILDANGWAVNARARINVPFGASLTGIAQLPPGARVSSQDRFGQRPAVWPKLVLLVVIAAFFYSLLNHYGVIAMLTDGAFGTPAGTPPGSETLQPQDPPPDDDVPEEQP